MNRTFTLLRAGLAVAALGLLLAGCPQPDGDGRTTYTVTFNANGGSPTPADQTVAEGGRVTVPGDMTRTAYAFGGWYKEAALTTRWNFAVDTVTADVTLHARWIPAYTVSFDSNGGDSIPPDQTVAENGTVTEPGDMTKAGYAFGGWFKESELTNQWNFDIDTVTADMTLHARWIPAYTVAFEAHGGAPVPPDQTVAEGGTVTEPAVPAKTGLTFGGWFKESELTTPWNFDIDTVTGNMTLYAKWTAAVTFEAKGGMPAPDIQTVAENGTVTEPEDMTKANHIFGGWYQEAALTTPWNFDINTVTGNMTLYAKWTYSFTTLQYRDLVPLTGGTVTGDSAYYYDSSDDRNKGVFIEGRTVILSPFSIAKYETTYELWYEVHQWAIGNGYSFEHPGREGDDGTEGAEPTAEAKTEPVTTISSRDIVVWCNAYSEMSGKEPVYYVDTAYTMVLKSSGSADSAKMKTAANGYRLPTEAEWEYAARGGGTPSTTGSFVYTYAGSETVGDVAWYDSNSDGTHPVGTKAANTALLYDMSGNVFEWCWDWWREDISKGTESNPTGPVPNVSRVIRGGSWYNAAPSCAVARRAESYRYRSDGVVGFRVASRP